MNDTITHFGDSKMDQQALEACADKVIAGRELVDYNEFVRGLVAQPAVIRKFIAGSDES